MFCETPTVNGSHRQRKEQGCGELLLLRPESEDKPMSFKSNRFVAGFSHGEIEIEEGDHV
jgi:hypothetical protein